MIRVLSLSNTNHPQKFVNIISRVSQKTTKNNFDIGLKFTELNVYDFLKAEDGHKQKTIISCLNRNCFGEKKNRLSF